MNDLLEKLHDIEGLDPISIWPLSPIWWGIIGVAIIFFSILGYVLAKKLAFKRSWKHDTNQKLATLEKHLSEDNARATILTLSEYLRRIALRRYPRKECAGLIGDKWLKWLTQHDPKQFDWENKGRLLIDIPYAPLKSKMSTDQVKKLIQAAKDWVY